MFVSKIKMVLKKLIMPLIALVILSILYFVIVWIVKGYAKAEPFIVLLEALLLPFLLWCHKKLNQSDNISENTPGNVSREYVNFPADSVSEFDIKILKSKVVDSTDGINYRFQINFALYAAGKSVYVREIKLLQNNVVFCPQTIQINSVSNETGTDYLSLPFVKYRETVISLNKIPVQDVTIRNDEWKYYLITDSVTGERLPDGYEKFILKDWEFIIIYNDNKMKSVKFDFDIHHNSNRTPTEYRYTNF